MACARFSGDFRATADPQLDATATHSDLPVMEQRDGSSPNIEYPGTFQEKRTRFLKEQIESAKIDLQLVRLNLGEIGVVGEIQRHTRCQRELYVQTHFLIVLGHGLAEPSDSFALRGLIGDYVQVFCCGGPLMLSMRPARSRRYKLN